MVGLYLISCLENLIPREHMGPYRDDGLAVLETSGPEIERLRKNVIKLFNKHGLKITTEVNIKITDFLDVVFDLESGSYKPFRKDASPPSYVNHNSNHPKNIIKELPKMVEKRISDLSINEEVFNNEVGLYNQALLDAGYKEKLKFVKGNSNRKRSRNRKVIWFNPPWNNEVSTNVAKKFLYMLEKHFPRGSEMARYFNRNTVKVSYCTMPNMHSIISNHNKQALHPSNPSTTERTCNCRSPGNCVLNGQCLTANLVYKNVVTSGNSSKDYIGSTSNTFKTRYTNHKASFNHQNKAHSTSLSSHIWELKDKEQSFTSNWSIMGLAPSYCNKVRKCQLCLLEKTHIALADPKRTLNKRTEIVAKCRHRDKMLLKNW